jgi:hypothetical protein
MGFVIRFLVTLLNKTQLCDLQKRCEPKLSGMGSTTILGLLYLQVRIAAFRVYKPGPVPLPLLETSLGIPVSWCCPAQPTIQFESP